MSALWGKGSSSFWAATAERAVKTAAQTGIATIGTTAMLHEVQWVLVGSASGLASVLSVLTSIASAAATDGSPSLASETLPRRAIEDGAVDE